MKKSQETWGDRLQAREKSVKDAVNAEIESKIRAAGLDLAHFEIHPHHNVQMRTIEVSVYQHRDSVKTAGRVAVHDDLLNGLDLVGQFLPGWISEKYHLVERAPAEPVHDGSAEIGTLFGRKWQFGPTPKPSPPQKV